MNMRKGAYALMMLAVLGCTEEDGDEPAPMVVPAVPRTLTAVATEGFTRPSDAVASHDGATFYFTAFRPGDEGQPTEAAVFSVSADGGAVTVLHAGRPLGSPTGLVMSCDNSTLYVADLGQAMDEAESSAPVDGQSPEDAGAVFAVDAASGSVTSLETNDIRRATGLALSVDCQTLYVTGWTADGTPAVFTVPVGGGAVAPLHMGSPLVSPTGLHVDRDGVAWVMDHLAEGQDGAGVLFAIDSAGAVSEVISNLEMGTPGGVSLDSTGSTAVMPTVDTEGNGQLTTVNLASGTIEQVPAPMMRDPAGLRTARNAAVFAVVDAESNTIYRAE